MDGECEQLDLIEIHRGCARRDEQNRVSLTDALFGPVGERRISDIEDEVDPPFQGVQPVRDRRVIERATLQARRYLRMCEEGCATAAIACASEPIDKVLQWGSAACP
jgi:hypothetical protein